MTAMEARTEIVCKTVTEFVDALGGNAETATTFAVLPSAVCNWKASGAFPDRLHLRVFREAESRGIKLGDNFFDGERAA